MPSRALNIGAKVKETRERKGLSLSELARLSGISRGYLHLIEKGESNPTEEKITAIAQALGVLVTELIGEVVLEDAFDIPASLKEFAKSQNLPSNDVIMLSKINYRGRRPESVKEWQVLYSVIKGTLGED